MKLIGHANKIIVGIDIKDNYMHLSSMQNLNNKLKLNAYYKYEVDNSIIYNLTVFNMHKFITIILSFFQTYKLNNAFIVISVDNTTKNILREDICSKSTDILKNNHINYYWQQQEVGYFSDKHVYICGIPQATIFQYMLFSMYTNFNIVAIVSQFASCYWAHKLNTSDIGPENLDCSLENVKSFLFSNSQSYLSKVDINNTKIMSQELLTAVGLYYIGSMNEAT